MGIYTYIPTPLLKKLGYIYIYIFDMAGILYIPLVAHICMFISQRVLTLGQIYPPGKMIKVGWVYIYIYMWATVVTLYPFSGVFHWVPTTYSAAQTPLNLHPPPPPPSSSISVQNSTSSPNSEKSLDLWLVQPLGELL